jgi:hypothetical protein
VVACAALMGAWWLFSEQGVRDFMRFRQGVGFQVESVPGALVMLFDDRPIDFISGALVVHDDGLGWVQVLMSVVLAVVPAVAVVLAWRRKVVDHVALVGALVGLALLSQRLLSPQFLVWLVPFVAWYAFRYRHMAWVFAACSWMTAIVVQCYGSFLNRYTILVVMVVVRNILLLGITAQLFRIAFRPGATSDRPALEQPAAVAD